MDKSTKLEPQEKSQPTPTNDELLKRISKLEERIIRLERLFFPQTSKYNLD